MEQIEVDTINLREFVVKVKSKVELYLKLIVEGLFYLHLYLYCTVDFMTLIVNERR